MDDLPEADAPAAVHRALADASRARMMGILSDAPEGLDVATLAHRVGLHPNTVRWHLAILADAALVGSDRAPRRQPGRPRLIFRALTPAASAHATRYQLLAAVLATSLRRSPAGPAHAEVGGRAWGQRLVRRDEASPSEAEPPCAALLRVLEEQGFGPRLCGSSIRMHRCPFGELALTDGPIVCAAHRGLVRGVLERLEPSLAVDALVPFASPGVCVLRLRQRGSRGRGAA